MRDGRPAGLPSLAARSWSAVLGQRPYLAGAAAAVVAAVMLTLIAPPRPLLIWNVSRSAPIGLYRIAPGAPLRRGDYALVKLPRGLRMFAARRGYLSRPPPGAPAPGQPP